MLSSLTHRERVSNIIDGRESDRVPLDFGGPTACSIHDDEPYGYQKLCDFLGLKNIAVTLREGSYVAYPVDERVLKRLDIDFRHIRLNDPIKKISKEIVEDYWGVKWRIGPKNYYPIDPPLAHLKKEEDIEKYARWPDTKNLVYVEGKYEAAKRLYEQTDFCIAVDLGPAGSIFHRYTFLRGFSRWFIDMKVNLDLYEALASKILEINQEIVKTFLDETADYVNVIWIGDDMGSQGSPFLSAEGYRQFVKPWFKEYIHFIKRLAPNIKIIYHTCGSVYPLISEFIECGVDVLNSIQPAAKGMDPKELKENYGGKICFHGGIDAQQLLRSGSRLDVEKNVRKVLEIMMVGGKYILAPSHHILGDVPPENIYTMYSTALKYGLYN